MYMKNWLVSILIKIFTDYDGNKHVHEKLTCIDFN